MALEYYEILGVEVTATLDEIKKAYKKKALETHPDRNTGDEVAASERFKVVGIAYETLSDPQKRRIYDASQGVSSRSQFSQPKPKKQSDPSDNLAKAIAEKDSPQVKQACQELLNLKKAIPEQSLIGAISSFNQSEVIMHVAQAVVQSGERITERVLIHLLHKNHLYKGELLKPILDHIEKTQGNLTDHVLERAIELKEKNYFIEISKVLAKRNEPINEKLIIAAMKNFSGTQAALAVMEAVVQSGGKVPEAVLIYLLDGNNIWKDEFLKPVLKAIEDTGSPLPVSILERAIKIKNMDYVLELSKVLAKQKEPTDEKLIIAAMKNFAKTEAALAVMEAVVQSGSKVSQAVLIYLIDENNLWKKEFLKPVLKAIEDTGNPLPVSILERAIKIKNMDYVIELSKVLAKQNEPIDEKLIIAAMKNFTGTQAALAVMEAVIQSGGKVSQAVLTHLITQGNAWKGDLLEPVLRAIELTEGELSKNVADLAKRKSLPVFEKSINALLEKRANAPKVVNQPAIDGHNNAP